jgi:tRNA threonylcarbamoyl adenosine modification protein (Sua5/YciO/YrdC/YwlC family)
MSQYFQIHPENPQLRLIRQAVAILREGGVIAYPTDSSYGLGCAIGEKGAAERIRRIRGLGEDHDFTLVCRDLSDIATYAKLDNTYFRLVKAITPGPYTFILPATGEVPRRLQHPKRKTVGIRVPDHAITRALLAELGEPMMSTTLIPPDDDLPMTDPEEIRERFEHQVDLVIDGGGCGPELSTVVRLTGDTPELIRIGKGDPAPFQG